MTDNRNDKNIRDALFPPQYFLIPIEILACREMCDLTWLDTYLFCLIKMLDNSRGCFASNAYLAKFWNVTEKSVSKGIARLIELNLIERTSFNGRKRTLRVNPAWKKSSTQHRTKFLSRLEENFHPITNSSLKNKEADETLQTSRARKRVSFGNEEKETLAQGSDEALQVIRTWNRLKCGAVHNETSKCVEKTINILDGKLLNKYGLDKIIMILHDYKYIKERPGYFKVSKRKSGIDVFFELDKWARTKAVREGVTKPRSIFQRLITKDGESGFLKKTDSNKKLTKAIKKLYIEEVLIGGETNFSLKQECDFIEASIKLKELFRKKKYEHVSGEEKDLGDHVLLLFNALVWKFEKFSNIRTGNLNSDFTYNDIIPRYLKVKYSDG